MSDNDDEQKPSLDPFDGMGERAKEEADKMIAEKKAKLKEDDKEGE